MTVNFSDMANITGLLGMVFLAIVWLATSRKLLGFLLIAGGCALIVVMLRSDRHPATLAGLLLLGVVLEVGVCAGYAMLRGRQSNARYYRAPARPKVVRRRA